MTMSQQLTITESAKKVANDIAKELAMDSAHIPAIESVIVKNLAITIQAETEKLKNDIHANDEEFTQLSVIICSDRKFNPEQYPETSLLRHACELKQERDSLRQQLSEAKKDVHRLDWLEKQPAILLEKVTPQDVHGLRTAIDAAINSQEKGMK